MAEEHVSTDGSQESLPLSQETFVCLLNQLNGTIPGVSNEAVLPDMLNEAVLPDMWNKAVLPDMLNDPNMGNNLNNNGTNSQHSYDSELNQTQEHNVELPSTNQVPYFIQVQQPYVTHCGPAALPAISNWCGEYSFTVSFNKTPSAKSASWTYSELKDKLYVGKDVHCPINFSTKTVMRDDVIIRAKALFSSADNASNVVHRCVNHSMEEISRGVFEAEHLIRCENSMASYYIDEQTGRHSVVVPFVNPAAGQSYSTYIFKFTCFGSCAGGPNRRPMLLVFTLEQRGQVIGRRTFDLKICACPSRDQKLEEKACLQQQQQQQESLPKKRPSDPSEADLSAIYFPVQKKKKSLENDKEGPFWIRVEDHDCYQFLKQMKIFYEIYRVPQFTSNLKRFISFLDFPEDKE